MRPTLELALTKRDPQGIFPEYQLDYSKLFAPTVKREFRTLVPEAQRFYKEQLDRIMASLSLTNDV